VLLFARGESIGRDTISAGQLLADAAQTVRPLFLAKGVAFRRHLQRWRRVPHWQPEGLAGALVNLLENALQACAEGGKVILGAEPPVDSCESVSAIPVPGSPPRSRHAFSNRSLRRAGRAPASVWRSLSAWRVRTGVPSMYIRFRAKGSEFVILLPVKAAAWREN
jgi:two-component system sensor histidine kinase FlrB